MHMQTTKRHMNLSTRQLNILKWIGEQYAVRMDHIQMLIGRTATQDTRVKGIASIPITRKFVIGSWAKKGLICYEKLMQDKPSWVWLSGRGLYHTGLPYRSREPSIYLLNHFHYINAIRLVLETKGIESWVSERKLRYDIEAKLYGQDNAARKAKKSHLPDGVIVYKGQEIAIEVELTRKSSSDLDVILGELDRKYQYVWYFAAPPARSALQGKIKNNPKFCLYDIESALQELPKPKEGDEDDAKDN